ncbi:unnamed protein product [Caretta caretta]
MERSASDSDSIHRLGCAPGILVLLLLGTSEPQLDFLLTMSNLLVLILSLPTTWPSHQIQFPGSCLQLLFTLSHIALHLIPFVSVDVTLLINLLSITEIPVGYLLNWMGASLGLTYDQLISC